MTQTTQQFQSHSQYPLSYLYDYCMRKTVLVLEILVNENSTVQNTVSTIAVLRTSMHTNPEMKVHILTRIIA